MIPREPCVAFGHPRHRLARSLSSPRPWVDVCGSTGGRSQGFEAAAGARGVPVAAQRRVGGGVLMLQKSGSNGGSMADQRIEAGEGAHGADRALSPEGPAGCPDRSAVPPAEASSQSGAPQSGTPHSGTTGHRGAWLVGRTRPTADFRIEHYYTEPGVHPYDLIKWEQRTAVIASEKGEVVFEQ